MSPRRDYFTEKLLLMATPRLLLNWKIAFIGYLGRFSPPERKNNLFLPGRAAQ
jgi:hypothetical protein